MIWIIIIAAVSFYSLACILVYFFQTRLLFFPRQNSPIYENKKISIKNGDITLKAFLLNKGRDKLLIYFGGNAEDISDNIPDFNTFDDHTILLPNYRGYGGSDGKPGEKEILDDALFIYDWIMLNNDKYTNIIVMGRSLGSGVASYLASKRYVDKLILVTPYDSIENVAKEMYPYLPVFLILKHKFNSKEFIKAYQNDVLVLLAEHDRVVSYYRSEKLMEYINRGKLKKVTIKGTSHNNINSCQDYWREILSFIHQ